MEDFSRGKKAEKKFTLELSNAQDLIIGTTILGTGGGGSPEAGRKLLVEKAPGERMDLSLNYT